MKESVKRNVKYYTKAYPIFEILFDPKKLDKI